MLPNCGAGEDSWEPLGLQEITPVNPKGNQSWIFIGKTDAKAEAPKLWPPDANSWLTGKDLDARKDWRQKGKRVTEDEMVGGHHRFSGHELGQTPGDGEGQASLCAAVHGVEKSQTWRGNWTTTINSSSQSWNIERKCELSGPSKAKLGRADMKQWTRDSSVFWFFVIQLLSCVLLFATPRIAACLASLSFTISQSLLKLMSIESVMPSNHLILLSPASPLAHSLSQHQSLFQWVSSLHQVPKYWSFSISPYNEHSRLISFKIDWFDLLAVQGTLKSLQLHSSKTSILWHSAFFMVQLSHLYVTTGKKTIALTIWTFLGKVTSLLFNILSRCVIAFRPTSILWGSGCTGSRIFCHLEFIWFQSVNVVSLGYAILLNIVTHSLPSCFSFSYLLDPCSREKQHYALIKVNFVSLPLFFNWFLHPLLWSTQQRGWRGE